MSVDFKKLATELVAHLVEIQQMEDREMQLGGLVESSLGSCNRSAVGILSYETALQRLFAIQSAIEGHPFAELRDSSGNEVLYALYGLQAKYQVGDDANVEAEVFQITESVARGGNCDSTKRPFLFANLSERQQELIREAVALEISQKGAGLVHHQQKLVDCDLDIRSLGEEIAGLEEAIQNVKLLAQFLATELNAAEAIFWLETHGRPYCHGSGDYASLVEMRLELYDGLQVISSGEILSKHGTPHTTDLKPLVASWAHLVGEQLYGYFDVRSAVLFRPPLGSKQQVVLYFEHVEGLLNEFGEFTRSS